MMQNPRRHYHRLMFHFLQRLMRRLRLRRDKVNYLFQIHQRYLALKFLNQHCYCYQHHRQIHQFYRLHHLVRRRRRRQLM